MNAPTHVILKADPNPDYDKIDYRGSLKIKSAKIPVRSFKSASNVCKTFIEKNELGGGNWTGGQILDEHGNQIAFVSYNGRVWEGVETGKLGNKEIIL